MAPQTEAHAEKTEAVFPHKIAKPKKRSRAGFACIACRRRKVRCDAQVQGDTCTNCALDKATCQIDLSRAGYKKNATLNTDEKTSIILPLPSLEESPVHVWEDDDCSIADTPSLKFDAASDRQGLQRNKSGAFPCQELRRHLVRCYLCHVYPSLPIIAVHQLVDIVNLRDGESPACGWFLLNALFATSIAFSDADILRRFGEYSRRDAFERFISEAKALYHRETSQRTYSAIQGLLLMSLCETEAPSDRLFWLSLAHAIATTDRLDQEPLDLPQPEKGLRKRLWWSLFSQLIQLDLMTDIRPRILVSHATVSALNDDDFETIIPNSLLGGVKQLDLLWPDSAWTSVGQNFRNWLNLFRPHHNCVQCRRAHTGCDSTFSAMANLVCCSCNDNPLWGSNSDQQPWDFWGAFSPFIKSKVETPSDFDLSGANSETSDYLFDVERYLFQPAFGLRN